MEDLRNEEKLLSEEIKNLNSEIFDIIEKLNQLKECNHDNWREKMREEVLRQLKLNFNGVKDRLKNLCQVDDLRDNQDYQVAITKLMGDNFNSIIVDNNKTAINCINFIKNRYETEKHSVIEKFIPVSSLDPISLDIVRSKIADEPGPPILAIDAMLCLEDDIELVLNCVLKDSIICNSDSLASDLSSRKKLNCVSLNGSYYKKSGLFSGGLANLQQKTKQWNLNSQDQKQNLKEKKDEKVSRLYEIQRLMQKNEETMNSLKVKHEGLNYQLNKYLKPTKAQVQKELQKMEQLHSSMELQTSEKISQLDLEINEINRTIAQLDEKRKRIVDNQNEIEDQVFQKFCKEFGFKNIREYEQGNFRNCKERLETISKYEHQLEVISSQIDYEKNRDTETPIQNLNEQVLKIQDQYNSLTKEKAKLDKRKLKIEAHNSFERYNEVKSAISKTEKIINQENSKLKSMQRELKSLTALLSNQNSTVSKLQDEKHNLLFDCKVNSIDIPLKEGNMKKLTLTSEDNYSSLESSEQLSGSEEKSSHIDEKYVEIDYDQLPEEIEGYQNSPLDRIDLFIENTTNRINALKEEKSKIQIDHMAKNLLNSIEKNVADKKKNYKQILEDLRIVKENFDKVRHERCLKFNDIFDQVSENIDEIFKNLYKNDAAQAVLLKENPEEPYLNGINFSCVIPNKRFCALENLSGGEKTMSALALLLATFRVRPTPFLIFDEIDAALDGVNISNMIDYFSELKTNTQIIIISHRSESVRHADGLVGVYISNESNSSQAVCLDLQKYNKVTSAKNNLKKSAKQRVERLMEKINDSY
ncbi:structural maintenance of chromosomes protein 1A-like [Trichogramma pretiosum]|uniref:structural maintenance of chromosomes protein 1A-like n=1 Tax=Trichogramma pretiosum TaxID=7493 RepID=UPI000C719506|nr:structural maintenance of chromosomes protein 1A-like [Trichogramma pretiosum]